MEGFDGYVKSKFMELLAERGHHPEQGNLVDVTQRIEFIGKLPSEKENLSTFPGRVIASTTPGAPSRMIHGYTKPFPRGTLEERKPYIDQVIVQAIEALCRDVEERKMELKYFSAGADLLPVGEDKYGISLRMYYV